MPEEELNYSRVTEAEEMINALCLKYPDILWAVRPGQVEVLGIENKQRTASNNTLAKCITVRGINKALFKEHNIPTRWVMEMYWDDWHKWNRQMRLWLLFHELLHIAPDEGKIVKHDIEDFAIIIDVIGILWTEEKNLPDLLNETVDFNPDLRPGVPKKEEKDEQSTKAPGKTQ